MASRSTRVKQLATAGIIGIGIAVFGVALPAQAADPVGAVTYSGFTTSQSGTNFTVDFDYAPVDPANPGTVQIYIANYPDCASSVVTTFTVPVTAAGHYHGVTVLGTSNRTYAEIETTNGVALVPHESNYMFDSTQGTALTATIVPSADPATGTVQVSTGVQRWNEYFQFEIDGVPAAPQFQNSCSNAKAPFPYAGLAIGSTLKVFTATGHVELASYTNGTTTPPEEDPTEEEPTEDIPPAQLATEDVSSRTGLESTEGLAHTGPDDAAYLIVGGILTALGVGFVIYANRRKQSLSEEVV